jgi:hypothetical protein
MIYWDADADAGGECELCRLLCGARCGCSCGYKCGYKEAPLLFPMELIGGNVQAPLDFAIGSLAAWLLCKRAS